jgi:hypothetical protein
LVGVDRPGYGGSDPVRAGTWAGVDRAAEPGEVRVKTLLIYGAKDPVAGPRHARWYQSRLPNARFEQVPGAGHLVVLPKWERVLSHHCTWTEALTALPVDGGRLWITGFLSAAAGRHAAWPKRREKQ